jgi:hypothetical protein
MKLKKSISSKMSSSQGRGWRRGTICCSRRRRHTRVDFVVLCSNFSSVCQSFCPSVRLFHIFSPMLQRESWYKLKTLYLPGVRPEFLIRGLEELFLFIYLFIMEIIEIWCPSNISLSHYVPRQKLGGCATGHTKRHFYGSAYAKHI